MTFCYLSEHEFYECFPKKKSTRWQKRKVKEYIKESSTFLLLSVFIFFKFSILVQLKTSICLLRPTTIYNRLLRTTPEIQLPATLLPARELLKLLAHRADTAADPCPQVQPAARLGVCFQ